MTKDKAVTDLELTVAKLDNTISNLASQIDIFELALESVKIRKSATIQSAARVLYGALSDAEWLSTFIVAAKSKNDAYEDCMTTMKVILDIEDDLDCTNVLLNGDQYVISLATNYANIELKVPIWSLPELALSGKIEATIKNKDDVILSKIVTYDIHEIREAIKNDK